MSRGGAFLGKVSFWSCWSIATSCEISSGRTPCCTGQREAQHILQGFASWEHSRYPPRPSIRYHWRIQWSNSWPNSQYSRVAVHRARKFEGIRYWAWWQTSPNAALYYHVDSNSNQWSSQIELQAQLSPSCVRKPYVGLHQSSVAIADLAMGLPITFLIDTQYRVSGLTYCPWNRPWHYFLGKHAEQFHRLEHSVHLCTGKQHTELSASITSGLAMEYRGEDEALMSKLDELEAAEIAAEAAAPVREESTTRAGPADKLGSGKAGRIDCERFWVSCIHADQSWTYVVKPSSMLRMSYSCVHLNHIWAAESSGNQPDNLVKLSIWALWLHSEERRHTRIVTSFLCPLTWCQQMPLSIKLFKPH